MTSATRTVAPDISYDAVIVVPGIMGSKLEDTETRQELWGFGKMLSYSKLWSSPAAFERLALSDRERKGDLTRVRATGLLALPAAAPFLRGLEGYGPLIRGIRKVLAHEDALLEFAYDWRLSVEHNARCLAHAARRHLDAWRAHDAHESAPVPRIARLVVVAHSMGGLVARALSLIEDGGDVPAVTPDIRATVTLGAPFSGAATAAMTLAHGDSGHRLIHRKRLQRLASTLPGLYDLLPMEPCVEDRGDVRRLTAADVATIGGDLSMGEAAIAFNRRLRDTRPQGHRTMIGTAQSTVQSLSLRKGVLLASTEAFEWIGGKPARDRDGGLVRRVWDGDGTVARDSAYLAGAERSYLAQQHGALAQSSESVRYVAAVITEKELGPRAGGDEGIGIDVPDVVAPGERWAIRVTGVEAASATCDVYDVESKQLVDGPGIQQQDGAMQALTSVEAPGVYRVVVSAGGTSPVTQLVLAVEPSSER